MDRDTRMARRIAEGAAERGGRAYYVGGYVRDRVMGHDCKDIDIEVHGLSPSALSALLDTLGERTVMGASFGIYGLKHYDIDIAMPRKETAEGRGHRDFEICVDPYLGIAGAARRRDFTMNALMQDVLTGEILDPYGGFRDIEQKRIRHVDGRSFSEDPLRVFRAAQFAARFGFEVAPETVTLCAGMDVTALSRERVFGETEKAMLKSEDPGVFFSVLKAMDRLKDWFPEIGGLFERGGEDRLRRGLVGAARRREEAETPMALMLSALCEPLTDEETARLLDRLTSERKLLSAVPNLKETLSVLRAAEDENALCRAYDRCVCPGDALLLCSACDEAAADFAARGLRLYRERTAQPMVCGADLIARGMRPGKQMGAVLAGARALQLEGVPKEEALSRALEQVSLSRNEKSRA